MAFFEKRTVLGGNCVRREVGDSGFACVVCRRIIFRYGSHAIRYHLNLAMIVMDHVGLYPFNIIEWHSLPCMAHGGCPHVRQMSPENIYRTHSLGWATTLMRCASCGSRTNPARTARKRCFLLVRASRSRVGLGSLSTNICFSGVFTASVCPLGRYDANTPTSPCRSPSCIIVGRQTSQTPWSTPIAHIYVPPSQHGTTITNKETTTDATFDITTITTTAATTKPHLPRCQPAPPTQSSPELVGLVVIPLRQRGPPTKIS